MIITNLSGLILIHSYLRWVVLVLVVLVLLFSFIGWRGGARRVSRKDERLAFWMTLSADLLGFIGISIWIFGNSGWALIKEYGMSVVMKSSAMRFYVIEHPVSMLIAIILLHIGKAKLNKYDDLKSEGKKGYKNLFIYTLISLFIILILIPWPWREIVGRALFPSL